MYMIVRWDGTNWVILHYSHDPDDTIRQYERFLEMYADISLLIDERVLDIHETRMKMKEESKQFAALRKAAKERRTNATEVGRLANTRQLNTVSERATELDERQ